MSDSDTEADIAALNAALATTAPVFAGPYPDLFAGTRVAPHYPASTKQASMEDDTDSVSDEEREAELKTCRDKLQTCNMSNGLLQQANAKLRGTIVILKKKVRELEKKLEKSQSKSSGGRKDTRRRRKKRRKMK